VSIADGFVETPHGRVTCALDHRPDVPLLICAHGAGGSYADRTLVAVAGALGAAGLAVLRFNFPYRERKSGRPDPISTLTQAIAAVADAARADLHPPRIFLGGRSMGGRAASMLAAEGGDCDGLILLAYPLHPPGQTSKLRDAHLPAIPVPVLCLNGTRDTFCERPLMDRVLERLGARWTMHWLEGADHSFRVLKSSGRTEGDVLDEVREAARHWLGGIGITH